MMKSPDYLLEFMANMHRPDEDAFLAEATLLTRHS